MVKVVNGTVHDELHLEDGKDVKFAIRTLFYDNGVVVTQRINGDWVQIKNADLETQEVGKCRDCGEMIYEHEDYEYSDKGKIRIQWHVIEDDCLPKCGVCHESILKDQKLLKDHDGNYCHVISTECGQ